MARDLSRRYIVPDDDLICGNLDLCGRSVRYRSRQSRGLTFIILPLRQSRWRISCLAFRGERTGTKTGTGYLLFRTLLCRNDKSCIRNETVTEQTRRRNVFISPGDSFCGTRLAYRSTRIPAGSLQKNNIWNSFLPAPPSSRPYLPMSMRIRSKSS